MDTADSKPAETPTGTSDSVQQAEVQASQGLEDYKSALQAWILGHHTYPARALRRKLTGVTIAEFTIDDSGKVVNTRVVESSGESILDKAALSTLKNASPMPAPPEGTSARTFPVPLSFKLNQ